MRQRHETVIAAGELTGLMRRRDELMEVFKKAAGNEMEGSFELMIYAFVKVFLEEQQKLAQKGHPIPAVVVGDRRHTVGVPSKTKRSMFLGFLKERSKSFS